ncbi:hypothetical protein L2E82_33754 [Cichorium intybus]|uniref:Uncharacterized protein n=1 Tax=Cichorium intybus TaxID=13427 RepID=A0ACB9BL20_CICIN|nr:hypothetical protein L2E82_33754 [Cichorium intybus]
MVMFTLSTKQFVKFHPPYADGGALLYFIRDPDSRRFRVTEKTEEEKELEEFVSFERYRDLIKHRRRVYHAAGVSLDSERNAKLTKPSLGSSSGLAKSTKPSGTWDISEDLYVGYIC